MRYLLTSLLILMATFALLATGCEKVARAPAGKTGDSSCRGHVHGATRGRVADVSPATARRGTVPVLPGDVAEVVVTGERPDWLMPEVVVSASQMPEVVVHASRLPAPVTLSRLSPTDFVN